jgi:hypothetical protein
MSCAFALFSSKVGGWRGFIRKTRKKLEKRIGVDFFPFKGKKRHSEKIMPGSRENLLSLWKILENVLNPAEWKSLNGGT